MSQLWIDDARAALRVTDAFDLAKFDRAGTPGFAGDKVSAQALLQERGGLLSELQERLYANGRVGDNRRVLVVVQGLDTAGKGGIARHVMGMIDPQGVALRSFGVPTEEERSHHYLWRIENALPRPGQIGLFDRSHYEDVLVVRVDELVPPEVWQPRFDEINAWEKLLVDDGVTVLKFALMTSYDEQALRLMERLDRPDKRWKYSSGDLKTRAKWDDYQAAYADVFRRTSTAHAPWYVLPADRKWYPRLAVTEILTRTLVDLDLAWPSVDWSPDEERRKLAATMPAKLLAESLAETPATVQEAIDEGMDVRLEVIELRDPATREAALATMRERRAELEADLARTLAEKRALLEDLSPERAAATPTPATPTASKEPKEPKGRREKKGRKNR